MAKNNWANEAFKKAQNLMSRGYNDFQPTTVVTKDQLSDLGDAITTSRPRTEGPRTDRQLDTNMRSPFSGNPWNLDNEALQNEAMEATEEAEAFAYNEDTDIDEVLHYAEDDLNKEWDINQPEDPNEKNSFFGEWWDGIVKDFGPDGGMGEGDDKRIAIAGEAISKLQKELNNLPTNTTPLTKDERAAVVKKKAKIKEQITEIRKKKQGYLKEGSIIDKLKWSDDSNGAYLLRKLKGEAEGSQYNNPGNIEKTGIKWDGEGKSTYGDNGRFTTFDTPEAGIAAMTKDLTTKLKDFNGDLKAMISKYAPELTQKELKNYMQVVQKTAGKKFKYTEADIQNIVKGFIRMENEKELADYYINLMDK